MKQRIFISSVQKEFSKERQALKAYILGDALLSRFFDVFLFEDIPAKDRRADAVYIEEVRHCEIYLIMLGQEYGKPDRNGLSPTHLEFNEATSLNKTRLVFVKGIADGDKAPGMQKLIKEAGEQLIRRRFTTVAELIPAVYASLVDYLAMKELLRVGPFDAAVALNATMDDLSADAIGRFVGIARRARGFPLAEDATPEKVLEHLNLFSTRRPTHAAILLFGKAPQRFLISSEVKCAHFHGTEVSKPIPFYQAYKGTSFDLVDQAVDFVLSKINLAVGTRELSTQAPVAYEIPPEVVREAIVNAIAHRDYTSNGSVQVMLFADRLEVWNPGTLPPSLTLEKLRHAHGSVPGNPLLAEPLYLTKYIERMGTGTGDMIKRCREAGLPEPEFALADGFVTIIRRKPERAFKAVGGEVTPPVEKGLAEDQVGTKLGPTWDQVKILRHCVEEQPIGELMIIAERTNRTKFRDQVLRPLLNAGLLEMTIPEKPQSSRQKYRLTEKGKIHLAGIKMKQKK
jgi:predicted HTH transcriptional regulator